LVGFLEILKGHAWWGISVMPATWEAEIRRIMVQGQTRQIVCYMPFPKNNQNKMDWRCGSSNKRACFASAKP
jgi:hypothetical protein